MRSPLIVRFVAFAVSPCVTSFLSHPSVYTAPHGPRSQMVVYQSIDSGSISSPNRSQTALLPA